MNKLREFYHDKHMLEEVYGFFMKNINEKALDSVFSGKETAGYKVARDTIDNAFNELKILFEEKKQINSKR